MQDLMAMLNMLLMIFGEGEDIIEVDKNVVVDHYSQQITDCGFEDC